MKVSISLNFKKFLIMPPAYYKYTDKEVVEGIIGDLPNLDNKSQLNHILKTLNNLDRIRPES